MKILVLVLALLGAAGVATYVRYGSFDPCVWLDIDTASASDLPRLVAQAQVRASFLLDGITSPTPGDCLTVWWDLKANGAATATE
jgi:hypothetical protein